LGTDRWHIWPQSVDWAWRK